MIGVNVEIRVPSLENNGTEWFCGMIRLSELQPPLAARLEVLAQERNLSDGPTVEPDKYRPYPVPKITAKNAQELEKQLEFAIPRDGEYTEYTAAAARADLEKAVVAHLLDSRDVFKVGQLLHFDLLSYTDLTAKMEEHVLREKIEKEQAAASEQREKLEAWKAKLNEVKRKRELEKTDGPPPPKRPPSGRGAFRDDRDAHAAAWAASAARLAARGEEEDSVEPTASVKEKTPPAEL